MDNAMRARLAGFSGSGATTGRGDLSVGLPVAAQFDAIYRANPDYYGTKAPPDFRQFLVNRSVDSLNCLDLGAGQGRYALHLARAGATVRAVDCSCVAMAQLAGQAGEERLAIVTEVADLCTYDFATAEYDLIVCPTVLDHLAAPCLEAVATAIVGALKPEGVFYGEVFTTGDPGWSYSQDRAISDTSGVVRCYFAAGELRGLFPALAVLAYRERVKQDRAHGLPHWHGLALLIGVKEGGS